ncbi:MAG TPA: hypothetical protein VK720_02830 [Terracidiphilus sp.]|jgi:hypothetical protein|nr:hypothetical protein [Terracidiphilus sp.]
MKFSPVLLGLSLAVACSLPAAAQDASTATSSAPKYLQVIVEYTKPGKGGLAHDKTEGAFVQAMAKANFPLHYTAFNAISGRARAIYLSPFNSFEEVEKATKIFDSPAVGSEFDRINMADGELLDEARVLIFSSDPELSYHSKTPGPKNRYMEADIVQVKPGHGKDFSDLMKLYMAAFDKAGSSDHWGAYRIEYGESLGTYVFLTVSNSETEIDQRFSEDSKIGKALSDDDKKKIRDLRAASIETERVELYSVNPAQSYATDDYVKADPDFWKPKPPTE